MADDISANIEGIDEVLAKLKDLDEQTPKIVAKANKAGAKVIKGVADGLAPVRSGLTKSNIRIRTSNKRSKGVYRANVGVGKKDWTGPAFYASFVLWGHKVGSRKLGGNRKQVPANNWLKAAAGSGGEDAANVVIETLLVEINAAASNGGK